jgi:hypothetical protein
MGSYGCPPVDPKKTEEAYPRQAAVHIFRVAAKDLAAYKQLRCGNVRHRFRRGNGLSTFL